MAAVGVLLAAQPGTARTPVATADRPGAAVQGEALIFADLSALGQTDLYTTDTSGRSRSRLTFTSGLAEGAPAASPHDASVAFAGAAPGPDGKPFSSIFLLVPGGGNRQITGGPADVDPAWRPAGDAVTFATRFAEVSAIVRTTIGTLQEQPLAQLESADHRLAQPAYRPDGAQLALVVMSDSDGGELWTIDAVGGGARRLFRHPGWDDTHPAWSPSGGRVTFAAGPWLGDATRHAIWLLDVETGMAGTIQTDPEYDLNRPAWSADGASIVYERRLPGADQAALFRIPSGGGNPEFLTSGESPDWFTHRVGPTPTGGPTAPGPTAIPATPTEGPPFPSLPPPPSTAPAFPTPGPPEPTSTGPAPTFPPPSPTPSPTRPTAPPSSTPRADRLFLPALPGREPNPNSTPITRSLVWNM